MIHEEKVRRALAFVAEFKGDERCSLNSMYSEALASEVLALSVKLEEAEKRLGELEGDVARRSKQYNELHETLEETQSERDALRADFRTLESLYSMDGVAHMTANQIEKIFDRVLHGETDTIQAASHGEIVKACPHCSALGPCMIGYAGAPSYFCAGCKAQFTEPAYYQRVKGSA